jgi:hypothetical protein
MKIILLHTKVSEKIDLVNSILDTNIYQINPMNHGAIVLVLIIVLVYMLQQKNKLDFIQKN